MIAYFDTSAVVPLLVAEAGSVRAASLWDGALLDAASAEGIAVAALG